MKDLRHPQRWRRSSPFTIPLSSSSKRRRFLIPRIKYFRLLLILAFLALLPPLFFHFRVRRLNQVRDSKCGWITRPSLVCAHGGESSKAPPNTMEAYKYALGARVDCIEIDVSRSADGVLFALHDRDLQRILGNDSAKVGHLSMNEIKRIDVSSHSGKDFPNQAVPTIEDALKFVSNSVRQVILDVKVGPPFYEKGLAEDIISTVKKSHCRNCLVWAKSDALASEILKLSRNIPVGYIVMKDPITGARSGLLRIKDAEVVGIYHLLIDVKLVQTLHGRGKKVYAWTVDDVESMRRMLFEHADAIVTGNPTLLLTVMQELKTECLEEGFSLP